MTQVDRLVFYIREHPGCTSLDITYNLRIVNVTGRISDARHEGHVIDARREGGVFRYYVVEPAQQSFFYDDMPGIAVANEATDAGSRR